MNSKELLTLVDCPNCYEYLTENNSLTQCSKCGESYAINDGILCTALVDYNQNSNPIQRWMENSAVAQIYNAAWRPFWFFFMKGSFSFQEEIGFYRDQVSKQQGLVLDLCCGPGYFTNKLDLKNQLLGVDLSLPMLKNARDGMNQATGKELEYIQGSVYKLPFKPGKVGGVVLAGALHLLTDLENLFKEISRVLASGGVFTGSVYSLSTNPVLGFAQKINQAASGLIPHKFSTVDRLAKQNQMTLVAQRKSLFTNFFSYQKE